MIGVEEGVTAGKREWEGEGTDRVSSNGAEPPKQMKLKLNNNYVNRHGWRISTCSCRGHMCRLACMPTYPL